MPVATTSKRQFMDHLETLGIESGMSIVVHSSMISFGIIEGGAQTALSCLLDRVGESGTLIAPAFTFGLREHDIFDPLTSEGTGTGELSELIRTTSSSVRGAQPIHSYAAIGRNAQVVKLGDPNISFGTNSIFSHFLAADTFWLTLGCRFDRGATYIHQCEALLEVPYREWLDLPRTRRNDAQQIESVMIRYFGTRGDEDRAWSPYAVEKQISGNASCSSALTAYGISRLMPTDILHNVTEQLITSDPEVLLVQPAN